MADASAQGNYIRMATRCHVFIQLPTLPDPDKCMNQRYSGSLLSGTIYTYAYNCVFIYVPVKGHMPSPAVSQNLTSPAKEGKLHVLP